MNENLMFEDYRVLSFLISFVPFVLNGVILFYLLCKMPRHNFVDVFSLLVFCLMAWQLEDCLLRLGITGEVALQIERVFSFSWLAVGVLICHFSGLFAGRSFVRTRVGLVVLYGPFFFFYIVYHSNPNPVLLFYDDFWGYTLGMREESLDLVQRYWIISYVLWGMVILFKNAIDKRKTKQERRQSLLIAVGILVPACQGGVTQMVFHSLGYQDVPLTSTFMTCFTALTWVALRKYKLFDISSLIEVEEVFHTLPCFVLVVSADLKIIYANLYAQKRLLETERVSGRNDFRSLFFKESDFLMVQSAVIGQGSESGKTKGFKTEFVGRKNEKVHVEVTAVAVRANSQRGSCVIIANDISQRVKAEKAVELAKEKYDLVSKVANEAFWERNLIDGTTRWGGNYFQLFGYEFEKDRRPQEDWEVFVHPNDLERLRESMNAYIQRGDVNKWEEEFRFRKKDGDYIHVFNRAFILKNKEGKAVRMVGSMQDVSELRSFVEKIKRQNQEISEIAHAQSHLVRAPLARIMGLVIYMREFGFDSEEKQMLLDSLMSSCEELDIQIREVVRKTGSNHLVDGRPSSERDPQ